MNTSTTACTVVYTSMIKFEIKQRIFESVNNVRILYMYRLTNLQVSQQTLLEINISESTSELLIQGETATVTLAEVVQVEVAQLRLVMVKRDSQGGDSERGRV